MHAHFYFIQMSRPIINKTTDKKTGEDKIELLPGSNVFVSASRLQQILATVKTGKQLSRKLMSIYWDRATLAKSTLSASSQHYEQLDPTIVTAIKCRCYNSYVCYKMFPLHALSHQWSWCNCQTLNILSISLSVFHVAYCVLFDNTARKSEIHSTMIDKCVQARRPRRSSLKQQEQMSTTCSATELEYHDLHISPSFSLATKVKEHDETEEDDISNLS